MFREADAHTRGLCPTTGRTGLTGLLTGKRPLRRLDLRIADARATRMRGCEHTSRATRGNHLRQRCPTISLFFIFLSFFILFFFVIESYFLYVIVWFDYRHPFAKSERGINETCINRHAYRISLMQPTVRTCACAHIRKLRVRRKRIFPRPHANASLCGLIAARASAPVVALIACSLFHAPTSFALRLSLLPPRAYVAQLQPIYSTRRGSMLDPPYTAINIREWIPLESSSPLNRETW